MTSLLRRYWYLLCVIPYLGFWTYGLTDLDEGFYGAVTMDMLRRGDWITPTLNGVPWFEKPILAYWLSMPFVSVMPNEFGARLPSFICTLASGWVLYRFVKKQFSEDTAILSTLIYSTSLLTVAIGRMMMTDAPLVLCLTIAFTTFYESLQGNQKLRLITATALGFAVLAKGPVALVVFGLIGIFTFWRLPDTRSNWNKHWITGTAILAVIIAAWYVPCYLVNGQTFIQQFLIEQNIGRFRGGDTAHALKDTDPLAWLKIPSYFLFYPLVIALSSLPWIVGAFRSKWWKTTETDQSKKPATTFLLIWFCVVLVFFSISGTKLVHYVLPCIPPLSILIAHALLSRHPKPRLIESWISQSAVVSVAIFGIAQYAFYSDWQKRFKDVQSFAIEAREKNLQLVEGNLGRSEDASDEVNLSLNDTGHPSLGFYYRKPIVDGSAGILETLPVNSLAIFREVELAFDSDPQKLSNGNTMRVEPRGRYIGIYTTKD